MYNVDPENQRVDALTHRTQPPVPFTVRCPADLHALRQKWAQLDSIPCLTAGREAAADRSWPGMDVRTLLDGDHSSGRLSFHDIIIAPGSGLPRHSQEEGDTYWYVVSGQVELTIGAKCERSESGTFGYAPSRTTQAVHNCGVEPARVYAMYSPAGACRAFLEAHEVWEKSRDVRPETYQAILQRYGFRFDLSSELENDARTNAPVKYMDATIEQFNDLAAMRVAWKKCAPTPKLIHDTSNLPHIVLPGVDSRVLLTGDEGSGSAVLFMGKVEPRYTAPSHHQPSEEESFFIIDGQLKLTCGSQTEIVGPGAFGFAPRGATHGFSNVTDGYTRFITMNSPAGHERGFDMIMREIKAPSERFPGLLAAHGWQMHDNLDEI